MTTLMKRRPQTLYPFPFGQLRDQFDSLLRDFFEGGEETETGLSEFTWRPRMDVSENEQAFLITVDLPGVKPDEVDISVTDNQLTVQGERSEEKETKDKKIHRVERTYGKFFRSMMLPPGCDETNIKASSDNGVIKITIPKTEEKKAKTIKIKAK